jgi:hypothetical protein
VVYSWELEMRMILFSAASMDFVELHDFICQKKKFLKVKYGDQNDVRQRRLPCV